MANISDKITQIRQAVYGKDVRESIASGIEAINDEVESTTARQTKLETTFEQLIINAGNSNAEIVDARGGFDTLREKLDSYAINVKDFGAKGDGVTDDTEAFINAINYAKTNGYVIFVPPGKYIVDQTLVIDFNNFVLIGAGKNTVLSTTQNISILSLQSSYSIVENISFIVPASNTQPVIMLDLTRNLIRNNFKNLFFESVGFGAWTGIALQATQRNCGAWGNVFQNIYMYNPKIGISILNGIGWATGNLFTDIQMSNFDIGIELNGDIHNNNFYHINLQHGKTTSTTGIHIIKGWGNFFNIHSWKDGKGNFTGILCETGTYINIFSGHNEGTYIDNGTNCRHELWEWLYLPQLQRHQHLTHISDITNENLLRNFDFQLYNSALGAFANWINAKPNQGTISRVIVRKFGFEFGAKIQLNTGCFPVLQSIPVVRLRGEVMSFGAYCMAPATNQSTFYISVQDGITSTPIYIPNDGQWHWVQQQFKISSNANSLSFVFGETQPYSGAPGDTFYITGCKLVRGTHITPSAPKLPPAIPYTPNTAMEWVEKGTIAYDSNYLYVALTDGRWKKIPLYDL